MDRTIEFRVIYNNEIFAYERLGENGWEWMVLELNQIGEERWIGGGVLKDSHKLIRNQFTGLFDKNGKKIFEHDYIDSYFRCCEDGEVIFKNGKWISFVEGKPDIDLCDLQEIEIKGNRYEIPK